MEEIRCTAWDLLSPEYANKLDWGWEFKIDGGRTLYGYANNNGGFNVKIGRIAELPNEKKVRPIYRYIHPDTPIILVPIEGFDYER